MTVADIDRAVAKLSQPTRELERTVKATLSTFCEKFGYPSVSRIKTEESIWQKIETGRYQRLSEIDDLVAFTIIIPTGSHENRCRAFIGNSFDVIQIKSKEESLKNPRQFTFDSTRIYARLRCPEWDEDREKILYRIIFEIQIRTALEHAWVTATHDVVYKSGTVDWQKVRLAAQIKAQIETIDLVFNNFEHFARSIDTHAWIEGEQKTEVIDFYQTCVVNGYIPPEKIPEDKIRLAENSLKLLSRSALRDLAITLKSVSLELLKIQIEGFPQNLTALQVFLLASTRANVVAAANEKFTPHITESFQSMFAEVKVWNSNFEYDY